MNSRPDWATQGDPQYHQTTARKTDLKELDENTSHAAGSGLFKEGFPQGELEQTGSGLCEGQQGSG